jgi:hypothetical protein
MMKSNAMRATFVAVYLTIGAGAISAAVAATTSPATTQAAYEIKIDTANLSPEMAAWADETLRPVCEAWYPRIVEMLPSDGYVAPRRFTVSFRTDMDGTPAMASGDRVMCNVAWFERQRDGEAIGAVVHEMVHVVQRYDGHRGKVPFWLQEGIPDYIRWYLYEPEKNGARIRDPAKVRYDQAYRTSANFLDWATRTYDADLVRKLNAAVRDGAYTDAIWPTLADGKTLDALDAEWRASLSAR